MPVSYYSRLVAKHNVLRQTALSRFDPSVNLRKWEDLLKTVIANKKRRFDPTLCHS